MASMHRGHLTRTAATGIDRPIRCRSPAPNPSCGFAVSRRPCSRRSSAARRSASRASGRMDVGRDRGGCRPRHSRADHAFPRPARARLVCADRHHARRRGDTRNAQHDGDVAAQPARARDLDDARHGGVRKLPAIRARLGRRVRAARRRAGRAQPVAAARHGLPRQRAADRDRADGPAVRADRRVAGRVRARRRRRLAAGAPL